MSDIIRFHFRNVLFLILEVFPDVEETGRNDRATHSDHGQLLDHIEAGAKDSGPASVVEDPLANLNK